MSVTRQTAEARDAIPSDVRGVERMRAIRSAGIPFSRNKYFAFYAVPANRDALRLEKYLRRLGDGIAQWGAAQGSAVRVRTDKRNGRVALRVDVEHLSYRRTAYLEPAELGWICEKKEVRAVLDQHGALDEALACISTRDDAEAS